VLRPVLPVKQELNVKIEQGVEQLSYAIACAQM
jgi:hypothetical protein